MQFQGGRTAAFTMTAFNKGSGRKTRIFGTRGEIYGDDRTIEHVDFLTDETKTIDTRTADSSIQSVHCPETVYLENVAPITVVVLYTGPKSAETVDVAAIAR